MNTTTVQVDQDRKLLAAQLHRAARQWQPPTGAKALTFRQWVRILSRSADQRLNQVGFALSRTVGSDSALRMWKAISATEIALLAPVTRQPLTTAAICDLFGRTAARIPIPCTFDQAAEILQATWQSGEYDSADLSGFSFVE